MSSSRAELFREYAAAADLLRQHFGDGTSGPLGSEGRDFFRLQRSVTVGWLATHLAAVAERLLELRFQLTVEVEAHRLAGELDLDRVGGSIVAQVSESKARQARRDLPESAEVPYRRLREWLEAAAAEVGSAADLVEVLTELAAAGVEPAISLRIQLNKALGKGVAQSFAAGGPAKQSPQPVLFFHPEELATYLGSLDLKQLEEQCFSAGQRTVFVVFELDGGFGNEMLSFVGRGREEELAELLDSPLDPSTVSLVEQTRGLHRAAGVWVQPSTWLIPEVFDVQAGDGADSDPGAGCILDRLRLLRALLASVFLADHSEIPPGETDLRVRYQGYGQVSFSVSLEELATVANEHLDALFALHVYAYEGYSVDKVEIAQRFLSLLAQDLETLCSRASEVRGATKQTYERALQSKVGEYFDARHKLQERIKTAVAEASDNVLRLTRDVSGDLYKVAGLVVAAVVAAFLKPELSPLALRSVGIAIGIYALIVLLLHVTTMKRSYGLRMAQHRSYIESFSDILRPEEIGKSLSDPELTQSESLLNGRIAWAIFVYSLFLAVGVFFVFAAGLLLVQPASPATQGWLPVIW